MWKISTMRVISAAVGAHLGLNIEVPQSWMGGGYALRFRSPGVNTTERQRRGDGGQRVRSLLKPPKDGCKLVKKEADKRYIQGKCRWVGDLDGNSFEASTLVFEEESSVKGNISGVTVIFEKGGKVEGDILAKSNVTFGGRQGSAVTGVVEKSTVTFEGDFSIVGDVEGSKVTFRGRESEVTHNVIGSTVIFEKRKSEREVSLSFTEEESVITGDVISSTVIFERRKSEVTGDVLGSKVTFEREKSKVYGSVTGRSTVIFEGGASTVGQHVEDSIVTFRRENSKVKSNILNSIVKFEGQNSRVVGNVLNRSTVIFTRIPPEPEYFVKGDVDDSTVTFEWDALPLDTRLRYDSAMQFARPITTQSE
jgi:hypothetical protein